MPLPSRPENYNLFFKLLERAFTTKNVPETAKSEILISILSEKSSYVLLNISENDLKNYEQVKAVLFRQFLLTPQVALFNFKSSQRLPNESHEQCYLHFLHIIAKYATPPTTKH